MILYVVWIQVGQAFPFVSYMIYYPLVLAMLIFNCFADAPPRFSEYRSVEVSEKVCLLLCLAFSLILCVYWMFHKQ
jgi:hypothetical protein